MTTRTKTIVVDIDGVILNFTKPFSNWWNRNNYDARKLPENPHDWQFDHPDLKLVLKGIEEFAKTHEPYDLMEPKIPEYLTELKKKYIVHLVTAFPERHKEFRIANLALHKIPYDKLTFADGHKIDLIKEIHPVALVEDSPKNIMDFVEHGYPVYVPHHWNYTKNLKHELITFYEKWEDLVDLIDH